YWSLSASLASMLESASWFIAAFEVAVVHEATRRRVAGVVCGHIHRPALRSVGAILYCNTGDWIGSCTAVLEHFDGPLKLVPSTPPALETESVAPAAGEKAPQ